jgi:RNA polymerase sigma-70 factor (ECF subfamily)
LRANSTCGCGSARATNRALDELITLTSPWLLGLVQGMLHDADEAEEVLLETYRLAWAKVAPVTEGSQGLSAWLARIARNRAIDRLRSNRRRAVRQGVVVREGPQAFAAVEPDEAATPGWHVHAQVHAALAALPAEQQEAVRLAFFEGLTHSEVAERLVLPLGTVKTRLRLAFGKLRTALADMEDWIR